MTARNPVDSPLRFVAAEASGSDSTLVAQGTICPRVLADPRSGARLRLYRVLPVGRGDYEVSAEQTYGAKQGGAANPLREWNARGLRTPFGAQVRNSAEAHPGSSAGVDPSPSMERARAR